jgi:hypothetical protein
MIQAGYSFLDKLNKLETREQKEHKEKTMRETYLLVSASETLAPANSLSVYSLVDFPNPFDNPDFVASLVNYDLIDPF